MSKNITYGSFKAKIPYINSSNVIEYKEKLVKPLTQKDYAEGWQLNIPKPYLKSKEIKLEDNIIKNETYKIYNVFRCNLAELPDYLYDSIKEIYRDGSLKEYVARDNRYIFKIQLTPVDDDIFALTKLINKPCYFSNDFEKMREYQKILTDNDISEESCLMLRLKKALEYEIV